MKIPDDILELMITRSLISYVRDRLSYSDATYKTRQAASQDRISGRIIRIEGLIAEAGALLQDLICEEYRAEQRRREEDKV